MKLDVDARGSGARGSVARGGGVGARADFSPLRRAVSGEVLDSPFDRGRYATDASIYQIMPQAVVLPCSGNDLAATLDFAAREGLAVTARGGGTSQSGQTTGDGLIVDFSRHLNRLLHVDVAAQTCVVEPGIVLDDLNRQLAEHDLWFPIDVSTGSRATLGGMAGNNSCGTRSLRYGIMRDRVLALEGLLADGTAVRFAPDAPADHAAAAAALALGAQHAALIDGAFPEVSRRVGGYNIDALVPGDQPGNVATLLVGSEGTLALTTALTLKLAPRPKLKALGVCHFPTFRAAMEAAQHIVTLGPVAVEVVDRTLIELARDIPMFAKTMAVFVRGEPEALLLTEFAEDDAEENRLRLRRLDELMGDLGHPDSVFATDDTTLQKEIWEVRKSGLNIMMSMKDDRKPVSFIEDCAVPLEHLADYTERLTEVFTKHGTKGTWYAHASVGCLHVRPVLNLKLDHDARTMRAIAEEAFALVREYKGAHSGEHGDGLVRSEFHAEMYGADVVGLFEEIKEAFDPERRLNPGKIVHPPRMNKRALFRYNPDYQTSDYSPVLDWSVFADASASPGASGFQNAVEMCNNNGACRKSEGGAMCPSFRATRSETHVVRGRANSLRLALSGQLGSDALASDAMAETLKLCVSCKACRRECPTGVDMARMKIEVLAARAADGELSLRDRLVAFLPRYAPYAARVPWLANLRDDVPGLARLLEGVTGFTGERALPRWGGSHGGGELDDATLEQLGRVQPRRDGCGRRVALFADTFNTYFGARTVRAARIVLEHLGYTVVPLGAPGRGRPVCCGRTFFSAGLVDQARGEARRLLAAATPLVAEGVPIVGLEPSCLLTLRDEFLALGLGAPARDLAAQALLFEEFLEREIEAGRIAGGLGRMLTTAHVHGHCHQKSFDAFGAMTAVLSKIDGLEVKLIESSCCGMAGAFGYQAETVDVSRRMAELALLPAVRTARPDHLIVADGFSCRHQIADGTDRTPRHAVTVIAEALAADLHDGDAQ